MELIEFPLECSSMSGLEKLAIVGHCIRTKIFTRGRRNGADLETLFGSAMGSV